MLSIETYKNVWRLWKLLHKTPLSPSSCINVYSAVHKRVVKLKAPIVSSNQSRTITTRRLSGARLIAGSNFPSRDNSLNLESPSHSGVFLKAHTQSALTCTTAYVTRIYLRMKNTKYLWIVEGIRHSTRSSHRTPRLPATLLTFISVECSVHILLFYLINVIKMSRACRITNIWLSCIHRWN